MTQRQVTIEDGIAGELQKVVYDQKQLYDYIGRNYGAALKRDEQSTSALTLSQLARQYRLKKLHSTFKSIHPLEDQLLTWLKTRNGTLPEEVETSLTDTISVMEKSNAIIRQYWTLEGQMMADAVDVLSKAAKSEEDEPHSKRCDMQNKCAYWRHEDIPPPIRNSIYVRDMSIFRSDVYNQDELEKKMAYLHSALKHTLVSVKALMKQMITRDMVTSMTVGLNLDDVWAIIRNMPDAYPTNYNKKRLNVG